MRDLTLPDNHYAPSLLSESFSVAAVSFLVLAQLWHPVVAAGLREAGPAGAIVLMPEAAVDENNGPSGREHQVRHTWEIPSVQPISIAERMN